MKLFLPQKWLNSVESFLNNFIAFILLIGMMMLVVTDVAGRYFFQAPVHSAMEVTEFLLVAIVFLTLAHTQAIRAHISVDLVVGNVSKRKQKVFFLITCILGFFIFGLIAWQGVLSAIDAWVVSEATDGLVAIPTFPAKLTIPIGSTLLCLRYIFDIMSTFKELRKEVE